MSARRKAISRREFLKVGGAGFAGMTLMTASACASSGGDNALEGDGGGGSGTVVVGSTNFPEQLLLANMYSQALEAEDVKVNTRLNLGSREVVFPSIRSGELDIMPEYTGALLAHLKGGEEESGPTQTEPVLEALRSELPKKLVALEAAEAQDKDVLVVTQQTSKEYNLKSMADLAPVADELVIGGPPEMETRRVGLPGLKEVYGAEFKTFRSLDAGGSLTIGAMESGDIDVGRVFSTQAIIEEKNWVILDDPENLVPAQNIIPIVRKDALTDTIRTTLNEISSKLTTELMTRLNGRLQGDDQESPQQVASDWLKKEGLTG